jgi:hypothetical protein
LQRFFTSLVTKKGAKASFMRRIIASYGRKSKVFVIFRNKRYELANAAVDVFILTKLSL